MQPAAGLSETAPLWIGPPPAIVDQPRLPRFMVPLSAGDTVALQGYFGVADGYFAADHTSFWGCKVG